MTIELAPEEYGRPDDEPKPRGPEPKATDLEPILLPRPRYLEPGQFGPGSVKGTKRGKIRHLKRSSEETLLKACSVSANLSTACRKAGLSIKYVDNVMRSNPAFKERVKDHLDLAIDRLETTCLRRAMVGSKRVKEVMTESGPVEITEQIPPSDRLAIKILESRRPEVYGRGREAGASNVTNIAIMTREQLLLRAKPALDTAPSPQIIDKPKT